ncbi:DUF6495 family protein [Tenacibaculum sp. IB213877]|uniref:DUF6495 family protein n=1 Tax=Tenacibaculum sp. IB213877 TaxID=3097351 RepID=UPI002A5A0103|nr:DUF6495 family protein [Tenacibaculum sp. IB213877]MDY0779647.1 DUF6495 family protein [Tenacibaculum sp. IB213877]
MKYRQLTKEQFESLHEEFAQFLASQSIDVKEWKQIKEEKPHVAEEEMNVFSDVVWDDVLTKVNYLEHFSSKTINLFKCDKEKVHRIVINIYTNTDLLTKEGYEWLLKNPQDKAVEYLKGAKKYDLERNVELFDLIEKGSNISKGQLFEYFQKILS